MEQRQNSLRYENYTTLKMLIPMIVVGETKLINKIEKQQLNKTWFNLI